MNISKSKTRNINLKSFIFNIFFSLSLLLSLSLVASCEQGTEPEIIKPGRRDYTWSVDTLQVFNTYLAEMWGSSPTDVWAVGHGGELKDDLWHYDGNEWKTDNIPKFSAWCIHGFSKDNIWIAGVDGKIWHYNGYTWSESLAYQRELNYKYDSITFMDIWGDSPNNIYAVGLIDSVANFSKFPPTRFGIIMHYNGIKWSRVNIGENKRGIFKKIRKGYKTSNKHYIFNVIQTIGEQDSVKYFEFDGKKLKEVYCGGHHWQSNVSLINNEVIFTMGDGIYTYNDGSFQLITENPYSQNYQAIYGRSKKDIIWTMADGLTHYNGTDFEYILNFKGNEHLRAGFVFNKTVFFISHGDDDNYIFKGVLK